MLRIPLITAISLVLAIPANAMCILSPTAVAVMQVNECVSTTFSKPVTADYSGTETIEGVMLGGTVERAWNVWTQKGRDGVLRKNTDLKELPKPPPGLPKGASAAFFLKAKDCAAYVGKTLNLVGNSRCCESLVLPQGPSGICILPWAVADVSVVSDKVIAQLEPTKKQPR